MTLRGTSTQSSASSNGNSNSTPANTSASSAGSGSLASAFARGDGQRHGSTESTATVRGLSGQRSAPMRVNTANRKLAQ